MSENIGASLDAMARRHMDGECSAMAVAIVRILTRLVAPVGYAEKVLARGDKIELLVDKTSNLEAQSFAFRKRSDELKWAMVRAHAALLARAR